MKRALILGYIAIAFVAGTYSYFFGDTRYRSYAYNLGTGLAWPIRIFSGTPEVDGDSPDEFAESYVEVLRSAQKHGLYPAINGSTNLLQFYLYARSNEAVSQAEYQAVLDDSSEGVSVMLAASQAVNDSPELLEEYMDYLDGMSAADIVDEREDLQDEIADIMEDRPAQVANPAPAEQPDVATVADEAVPMEAAAAVFGDASMDVSGCVGRWTDAHRAETGEEAVITADQIGEWEQWCAEGREPGQGVADAPLAGL